MKLTKDEITRLEKLKGMKSEEMTDEEKKELKSLQEKADADDDPSYKGDLSQEAFDKEYALSKRRQKRADEAEAKNAELQAKLDKINEEKMKADGKLSELVETQKAKIADQEAELSEYRARDADRWKNIAKNLSPKLKESFGEGEDPATIRANIRKYDEFVSLGFIDSEGNPAGAGGGDGRSGGYANLKWADLMADLSLAKKVKDENPSLYAKLKEEGLKKPTRI